MNDVVVMGAGSAGALIASRLAAGGHRVVLIEAGPDYETPESLPTSLADANNPDLATHDWGWSAMPVEGVSRPPIGYPQGRLVGGSSMVNGAVAMRGRPSDYEEWSEVTNGKWSWDSMLSSFMSLESDEQFGSQRFHSDSGPIAIIRNQRSQWPPIIQALAQECRNRGIPQVDDQNAPDAEGVGPVPRNISGGFRESSLACFLNQSVRDLDNLSILSGWIANRVIFDGTRAVAVSISDGNETQTITAKRFIIACGVIGSPTLLVKSGIGPSSELDRIGIRCMIDSPNVGKFLQDHPRMPIMASLAAPTSERGILAICRRSSSIDSRNDLAIFFSLLESRSLDQPLDIDSPSALLLSCVLLKPESRGWLRWNRTHSGVIEPDIHLNFLDVQSDLDKLDLLVDFAWSLLTSPRIRTSINSLDRSVPDAQAMERRDPGERRRWIRFRATTGFHGVGTCRMGLTIDDSVVSPDLRVHGSENLFVADASVMPSLPAAPTNLTCYAVANRAAELFQSFD